MEVRPSAASMGDDWAMDFLGGPLSSLKGIGGSGFRDWGLGFRVWGLGFGVWGLGFGIWGWGLGFGVGGWVQGLGFRV